MLYFVASNVSNDLNAQDLSQVNSSFGWPGKNIIFVIEAYDPDPKTISRQPDSVRTHDSILIPSLSFSILFFGPVL